MVLVTIWVSEFQLGRAINLAELIVARKKFPHKQPFGDLPDNSCSKKFSEFHEQIFVKVVLY